MLSDMYKFLSYLLVCLIPFVATSCLDELETKADDLESRVEAMEDIITSSHENAVAMRRLLEGKILITGYQAVDHGYVLSLSDGTSVTVTFGLTSPSIVPILGINEEGGWIMSVDGGKTFSVVTGMPSAFAEDGATPIMAVNEKYNWIISFDNGQTWEEILGENGIPLSAKAGRDTANSYSFFRDVRVNENDGTIIFTLVDGGREIVVPYIDDFYARFNGYSEADVICLQQELTYDVELSSVKDVIIQAPERWVVVLSDGVLSVTAPSTGAEGLYTISIMLISPDGLLKNVDLTFMLNPITYDNTLVKEYRDFLAQNDDNVLLDFSYAGYSHGEIAPPDVETLGWKVYDVTDYGAIPDDNISDRDAFLECIKAATGKDYVFSSNNARLVFNSNSSVKAIIYFPEGDFILHSDDDDHEVDGKKFSRSIVIRSGDIVLKGAGRDKTNLVMAAPMQPLDESELYSSPTMLGFQHYSGEGERHKVDVVADAPKGSFTITVSDASPFKVGDYVCLTVVNTTPEAIAEELAPYEIVSTMADIRNGGVKVKDIHMIKEKSGNTITFYEPLMHGINASWGWKLNDYSCYKNVGIEDLSFKGYANADFKHHGSWEDDGGYKPLLMQRLVNSWIRRVDFIDISEGATFSSCANSSAYDIVFKGNRGHSSVRSTSSSRIFIGATKDITSGPALAGGAFIEGAGHCHGVGVTQTSIGAVLWNNTLGLDSFVEMHGGQPRATLLDCSTGAFKKGSQGGSPEALPNHLADLTIWNYASTNTLSGEFTWWEGSWRFLPPVIVGLHGPASGVNFPEGSYIVDSNRGQEVEPRSLYEAQLKLRLGYVPAWLLSLN